MTDTVSLLRETGAMLEGHFLLTSGKHSDRYFQCARLLQHADRAQAALAPVAAAIRASVAGGGIEAHALVGPAMGGIVAAYELGRQLGLPAFFTERGDDGRMTLRRGFEVSAGQSLIIVEDVITTGKTSAETAAILEAMGARVSAFACVVDRRGNRLRSGQLSEGSAPLDGRPVFASVRLSADVWDAADCPLCGRLPLVKPGSRKMSN